MSPKDLIKKRILIVGSNGMLGQRLSEFLSERNYELFTCSVEEESFNGDIPYIQLDITKKNKVRELIYDFFPDYVLNTAAYTNVDKSETEKELAYKINVTGVENLALYTWAVDGHLIHVSTDYVFNGEKGPYTERDKPDPINYYGRTKLAGENTLSTSGVRNSILRTNVLYGVAKHGRSDFVKWVFDSLSQNKTIKIVTDQINNPTYIDDLVLAINLVIEDNKEGCYHIGGSEFISRFEFTNMIADYFKLNKKLIQPIKTGELNQPARRPLRSGLVTLKAQTELGFKPRSIQETFLLMKKELNF